MANAEQLLISSVLRDSDVQTAIGEHVSLEMFRAHPDEWGWIENYFSRFRKTPSKAAFRNKFPKFKIRTVNDTAYYSGEVRKEHVKTLLTVALSETGRLIADGKEDDAVALMSSKIISIAANTGVANDSDILTSYKDILRDVEVRKTRVEDTGYSGVTSGFAKLDRVTGGFHPGTLTIVGARLGEGKSWMLQRAACSAVIQGEVVQFDALEQSRAEVGMRIHSLLSSQSSVSREIFNSQSLMRGQDFDLGAYKKFLRETRKGLAGKLHVADTSRGRMGLMTIASQIERNKPSIVFIDYITLMEKSGSDWQDVAALSSGLKTIAQQYNVAIVAAAQLNRSHGLTKDPAGAEALAQSDAIGQDADMIITLKQQSPSTIACKLAKNRNGRGGFKWYIEFKPGEGIFREVPYSRMLEIKDEDKANAAEEEEEL